MSLRFKVFLAELKRRKVLRAAAWYAPVGWAILEASDLILTELSLPPWTVRFLVWVFLLGFPVALVTSWFIEITPSGIRRTLPATHEELAGYLPARWTRAGWALVGAGTLLVVAAVYLTLGGLSAPLPEDRVAVFPLQNLTGDPDRDGWGRAAAIWLIEELSGTAELHPEPLENLQRALGGPGNERDELQVAEELGLGRAVMGEYLARGGDSVEFRIRIRRVPGGQDIDRVSASGPASSFQTVIDSVGQRVAGALAAGLDIETGYYLRRPFNYQAYQAFWQGNEDFNARRWAGAIEHYWEAYQRDTTFLTAVIGVAQAARNDGQQAYADSVLSRLQPRVQELEGKERFWYDWLTAEARSSRRLTVVRTEMKRDPDDVTRILLGMDAVPLGYVWEAVGALEEVDPEDPLVQTHWHYWRALADAYHLLDRYQDELEVAQTGREHYPDDTTLLTDALRALLGMGDFMRLDSLLTEVQGMENIPGLISPGGVLLTTAGWAEHHGHPEKATEIAERALEWEGRRQPAHPQNIAWGLLMANRPREGLELLDTLISETPNDPWLHGLRGIALAMTGQEAEAQEEADWLAASDLSNLNGRPTGFRAEIAALLGQKETAVQLLRQSLREGRIWWDLYPVGDFLSLVGYEPFDELRKIKDRPPPEPSLLEKLKALLR